MLFTADKRFAVIVDEAHSSQSGQTSSTKMAFGEITNEYGDKQFTEIGMNNVINESELPEKFSTEKYQVLLVLRSIRPASISHSTQNVRR